MMGLSQSSIFIKESKTVYAPQWQTSSAQGALGRGCANEAKTHEAALLVLDFQVWTPTSMADPKPQSWNAYRSIGQ